MFLEFPFKSGDAHIGQESELFEGELVQLIAFDGLDELLTLAGGAGQGK